MIGLILAIIAEEEAISVGKLRSAADTAFSKGDLDHSLKLWKQVSKMLSHNKHDIIVSDLFLLFRLSN